MLPDKYSIPNDIWDVARMTDSWNSLLDVTPDEFSLENYQILAKKTFELLYNIDCRNEEMDSDTIPKYIVSLMIAMHDFSKINISNKIINAAQLVAENLSTVLLYDWNEPRIKIKGKHSVQLDAIVNKSKSGNYYVFSKKEFFAVFDEINEKGFIIATTDFDLSPILNDEFIDITLW